MKYNKDNNNVLIGANIAFYRNKKKISQEVLAEYMSISRVYVARIELGYHSLRLDQIILFAKSLGIHYCCLLEGVLPIACELYTKIQKLEKSDYDSLNNIVDSILSTI